MNKDCTKKSIEELNDYKSSDFLIQKNLVDFFALLLEIAKRNKELWKEINQEKIKNKTNL